jgi:hypothetical protein
MTGVFLGNNGCHTSRNQEDLAGFVVLSRADRSGTFSQYAPRQVHYAEQPGSWPSPASPVQTPKSRRFAIAR